MNDLPILDPHPLQDLLDIGAGKDVVRDLVEILRQDAPTRLALLRSALAAGDAPQVLMEAHQLKGSLGSLGLLRFAELARLIEGQAREGQLEGVSAWLAALPGALEEGLRALEQAFPAD